MSKRNRTALFILISAICISIGLGQVYASDESDSKSNSDQMEQTVTEVMKLIHNLHNSGISEEELKDAAIQGMIERLNDPYSEYFSPDEAKQFTDMLYNQHMGIGVNLGQYKDGLHVIGTLPGTPAAKAGIQAGDIILSLDGAPVRDYSSLNQSLSPKKAGDTLKLTVKRGTAVKTFNLTVEPFNIPLLTHRWLGDKIGYIQLASFTGDAAKQFDTALSEMESQGMRSLVIDLRNNGGGLIDIAKQVAAHFIPTGVLMYTVGTDKKEIPVNIEGGRSVSYPVIVMVNQMSASASELLAGSLQDHKTATLVGTTTFGKGVYQNVFPLLSGEGTLKLTTGEYLTPNRHKVNHIGITPDIQISGDAEQLLAALHAAGSPRIDIQIAGAQLTVNQMPVLASDSAIRSQNSVLVNARLLTALAGGQLKWDSKLRAVKVMLGNKTAAFAEADGLIVRSGTSYINLNRFSHEFPSITWGITDKQIELQFQH